MHLAQPRHEWLCEADEYKGGQKNSDCSGGSAQGAQHDVADEGCGREEWAGCELTGGNSVQQLLSGQPAEHINEISLKKRHQHVAASEQHRPDFEKIQEQAAQACRARSRCQARAGKMKNPA